MVTPLDLLNAARKRNKQSETTFTQLQQGSAGTINNIEILDHVFAEAYLSCKDWDFNDNYETVTLTSGNATIPISGLTEKLDVSLIKHVKYIKGDKKIDIPLAFANDIQDYILSTASGEPKYFYNEKRVLKVHPIPNSNYQLQLIYQGILKTISTDNILTELTLPEAIQKALKQMIYAKLLEEDGEDTATWERAYGQGLSFLQKAENRNKQPERLASIRKFRTGIRFGRRR